MFLTCAQSRDVEESERSVTLLSMKSPIRTIGSADGRAGTHCCASVRPTSAQEAASQQEPCPSLLSQGLGSGWAGVTGGPAADCVCLVGRNWQRHTRPTSRVESVTSTF